MKHVHAQTGELHDGAQVQVEPRDLFSVVQVLRSDNSEFQGHRASLSKAIISQRQARAEKTETLDFAGDGVSLRVMEMQGSAQGWQGR